MKPEEIRWTDWSRIVFGEVPPEFYLELIIRAVLVYLLLHLSMRMLGKRMATQMNVIEMTAMVALASAIGVPMLSPDRGILPAFIIAAIIVGITRLLARLNFKSQHFEAVAQGDIDMLVADSKLNLDVMQRVRVSQDRLFAHIRSENIHHLGSIKRLYMEANGSFTMVENEEQKPGLSVLPAWDEEISQALVTPTDITVCASCGAEARAGGSGDNRQFACPNCGASDWTKAVIEKSEAPYGSSKN